MAFRMVKMSGRDLRTWKGLGLPPERWMSSYRLVGRVQDPIQGRKDAFWFAPAALAPFARAYLYVQQRFEADLCRALVWLKLMRIDEYAWLTIWNRAKFGTDECARWFWERA